ncbi:MAG: hypothetical protein JKY37_34410 [Nannocystaceae bacterium]|nr:hypothetical protein [Nannocystaceae bacterium]
MNSHTTVGEDRGRALRRALLGNAAFSGTSAVALMFTGPAVAPLFGLSDPTIVHAVGAGLGVFGGALAYTATREQLSETHSLLATVGDLACVAGSAVLLGLASDTLAPLGIELLVAVAVVVTLFAGLQIRGLLRLGHDGKSDAAVV